MSKNILIIDSSLIEKHQGQYFTNFTRHIQFNEYKKYFNKVSLLAPVKIIENNKMPSGMHLGKRNFDVIENVNSTRFKEFYLNYFENKKNIIKILKNKILDYDIILIYIPSPILQIVANICKNYKKPYLLFVTGDIVKGSITINAYHGIKKYMYYIIGKIIKIIQYKAAKNASLIYAFGNELMLQFIEHNKATKIMLDSTIRKNDIYYRDINVISSIPTILRVGWIGPAKGYEYFVMAINELKRRNIKINAKIIGRVVENDYYNYIKSIIVKNDLSNIININDNVPFDKMKNEYLNSDIHVISSVSEGIPRVIIEGAAFGLPLVTTNAGGITTIIENGCNGLIVESRNHIGLADGIESVIKNKELRKKIITGGYELAHKYCIEEVVKRIANDIKRIIIK